MIKSMKSPKFKVGDVIFVRVKEHFKNYSFAKYYGKSATIMEIHKSRISSDNGIYQWIYKLDIDEGQYKWFEKDLEEGIIQKLEML